MIKRYITITILLISVLVLTGCGVPGLARQASEILEQQSGAWAAPAPTTTFQSPVAAVSGGAVAALEGTLENIYAQVNPSVVNIRVVQKQTAVTTWQQSPDLPDWPGLPEIPFEQPDSDTPQQFYQQGQGSGFVWDKEGHIVTNNHVVADADKIQVTFSDGTIVPATLVGADSDSDLAVVKVDVPAEQLRPVQLADSTQVQVGELVVAIGNPFGLEGTMTVGFVSALGRSLSTESDGLGPSYTIPDIIQTDASLNPGNSGGVLVDDQGRVVGVTAAIESSVRSSAGVGFVIPSAIVQNVVPELIKAGHYDHPRVGISGTTLTPDLAQAMDLSSNQRGILVAEVLPDSPADKAGLRGSDRKVTIDGQDVSVGGVVITAIDGQPLKRFEDLVAYLARSTQVGQTVTLTVLRDGKEESIKLTLDARPKSEERIVQSRGQDSQTTGAWLGIVGVTVNSDIAQAMNLSSNQQGVLIQQVEQGSPADQAGLHGSFKPITLDGQQVSVGGDIITAVDGQAVEQMQDLKAILQHYEPGKEVMLTVLRDGKQVELEVTLGQQP